MSVIKRIWLRCSYIRNWSYPYCSFSHKNCRNVVLIANRPRAKISKDNVEARRTSCLTTLMSHRSFRAAEILLASTTCSHWDAKVIYSSDRWWEEAMTSPIDNMYLKIEHAIIRALVFFYYLTICKNLQIMKNCIYRQLANLLWTVFIYCIYKDKEKSQVYRRNLSKSIIYKKILYILIK